MSDTLSDICSIYGCLELRERDSFYCAEHRGGPPNNKGTKNGYPESSVAINTTNNYPSEVTQINDHIKVNIEQTAKGARVTVTYDRSDHNVEEAVNGAIQAYETTILELKERGLKVDEA